MPPLSELSFLSPLGIIILSVCLLFTYICTTAIYNLYFHPLARYPGPKLWAAYRFPYVRSLTTGNLAHQVKDLHDKYGEVVRIGPDELSFIQASAWKDIYAHRPGHKPFPRNPKFRDEPANGVDHIMSANEVDHTRIRKLLNHAFSEQALREQEPIVQEYTNLFIKKLHEQTKASGGNAIVDIVQWYTWFLFDVIGDLGFGESFHCLETSQDNPWISMIFKYLKGATLIASTRFYPPLGKLLEMALPKSIIQERDNHIQQSHDKVHRRLKLKTDRHDFMYYISRHNDEKGMSVQEIESTAVIVIVGGSDGTSTVLSGTTNYLLKSPEIMKKVVDEIRGEFKDESEITFANATSSRLPYLTACLQEGTRVCPAIAAGLPRAVPQGGDTVCGHWLRGGTAVSVFQWAAYHSSSNFAEPDQFIPERWLDTNSTSSKFEKDRKDVLHPFGVGPRSCIGQNLAWVEMRLLVSRLLWNFDLSLPGGVLSCPDWAEQKTYILVEKKPLEVRLTPVKRKV